MTTLIAVYNSDGCVARCDARCYDAKNDGCDCICGGKNHGAGMKQAVENTREMADQWLNEYTQKKNNLESWSATVPAKNPVQLTLFK